MSALKQLSNILKEQGGQRQVDGDTSNVIGRRDKRTGGHGGIYPHTFQHDRHHGGHTRRYQKRRNERNPDDHPEKDLVPQPTDHGQHQTTGQTHQERDLGFPEKNLPDICQFHMPRREPANNQRGGL